MALPNTADGGRAGGRPVDEHGVAYVDDDDDRLSLLDSEPEMFGGSEREPETAEAAARRAQHSADLRSRGEEIFGRCQAALDDPPMRSPRRRFDPDLFVDTAAFSSPTRLHCDGVGLREDVGREEGELSDSENEKICNDLATLDLSDISDTEMSEVDYPAKEIDLRHKISGPLVREGQEEGGLESDLEEGEIVDNNNNSFDQLRRAPLSPPVRPSLPTCPR